MNTMKKNIALDTDDSRWQAVVDRSKNTDDLFFYAVKTTGVYCRPTCSSKLPNRYNVEFFNSSKEAEAAGYRACKRCRPHAESRDYELEQKIIRACRSIETSEAPLKLKDLASQAGLSQYHFHRIFKKIVGVTPKQYSSTCRSRRFVEQLKTSSSVTEAIYSAGYSSNSGAYDKRKDQLSMNPKVYRKGAAGVTITYGVAQCFLGWVIVAATERGVCSIEFGDDPDTLPDQVQSRFPKAHLEKAGDGFAALIKQVVEYMQSPETGLYIPLDIQGTAFQQRVWEVLRQIRPGQTMSYAEVAEKINNPKAVRAVASACGANRIAVAIPCHRVVTKGGKVGGYRWGAERKQQLLDAESDGS